MPGPDRPSGGPHQAARPYSVSGKAAGAVWILGGQWAAGSCQPAALLREVLFKGEEIGAHAELAPLSQPKGPHGPQVPRAPKNPVLTSPLFPGLAPTPASSHPPAPPGLGLCLLQWQLCPTAEQASHQHAISPPPQRVHFPRLTPWHQAHCKPGAGLNPGRSQGEAP